MATRRLPVIQEPTGEDAEAAARPAWQWVLIGSGLLVTIWIPCAVVVDAVLRKIAGPERAPGATLALLVVATTFGLASVAAGYLVARFGPGTRPRHAVFAGLLAALEIWLLVLLVGAFPSAVEAISALFALSALAAGFCALGPVLARRGKRSSPDSRGLPQ